MKRILWFFLFVCLGVPAVFAQSYSPADPNPADPNTVWYAGDWDRIRYADDVGVKHSVASEDYVLANFGVIKGSATGSLTNSALGCTTPATIAVTGAVVGKGVNIAWYGSSVVPAGIYPTAQISAAGVVTYSACTVISLSVASRTFIINLL